MKGKKKKQSSKQKELPLSTRLHIAQRLREGALIVTVTLSIFLFIALFSYHRVDPGWTHATSAMVIKNAAGRTGAWLSDFFLALFGYFAYIFPLMICYAVWLLYRYRHRAETEKVHKWLLFSCRFVGFLIVLFSGCALLSLHMLSAFSSLPYTTGGILGTQIAESLFHSFNLVGSTLILLAAYLIGITLFTGLSWLKLMDRIGRFVINIDWSLQKARVQSLFARLRSFITSLISRSPKLASNTGADNSVVSDVVVKPEISTAPIAEMNIQQSSVTTDSKKGFKMPNMAAPPKRRRRQSSALPKLSLLDAPQKSRSSTVDKHKLQEKSLEVELRLADFNVQAKVVAVSPGPVVTRYELQLAAGTKVSKITGLAKDLARSLSVVSVRVVEVIPGKSVIGLELPNENRQVVTLQEVLASKQYENCRSALTLALGNDIAGHPVVVDLAKMPHLLVAGTTGSGKSVSLNAMLLSLLYKSTPKELRLILIDPKMLELSIYDGIPHLLAPVVTDMRDAASALRWCVVEMERRYRLMAALGVRHIAGYNLKVKQAQERGRPIKDPLMPPNCEDVPDLEELPQIVVLADEFADMMVVVGKKVETLIARLAQKARAAGVHLIFATQRPSVDVITGLIKANIPTRIAFQVSSKIDSRTILDQQGAEQLLGHGDMLYLPPGSGVPVRVHGAFVSDDEVHRVVKDLKDSGDPEYVEDVLDSSSGTDASGFTQAVFGQGDEDGEKDALYDQAVDAVVRSRRVSISSIQRRFKIGYNRAARIVEAMEAAGVVSSIENTGTREVLAPPPAE